MTPSISTMYSEKSDAYFGTPRLDIAPLLPCRTDRVLEVGCGAGATMRWLREHRDIEYAAGIELTSEAAESARGPFDTLITGDIETMTSLPEGFDLILALDVLEHLVDPWSVVARLRGALKPGGVMIVSLPHVGHFSVSLPLLLRGEWTYREEGLLDRTHLRFFTQRTAIELLTGAGLVVDMIRTVRVGPDLRSPLKRWYALKLLSWILPARLLDWQFLIRAGGPSVERA
jgi:SAM-dependent methyltransferase